MKKLLYNKKHLQTGSVYAGVDETKECFVYVGGRYYEERAQIHLSREEAEILYGWLGKHFGKPRCLKKKGNK